MGLGKIILGIGVVFLVLAYLLHTPYPDGIHDPYKKSVKNNVMRTIDSMARIGDYFGIGDEVNNARRLLRFMTSFTHLDTSSTMTISNAMFDGVEVRIYQPKNSTGLMPGLFYVHGGGWVFFEPVDYDPLVYALARDSHTVVVSVNYRRAPEHPYPAGFIDSVKAIKYMMKNAHKYGIDKDRIGLAGDSAGGNIGAATVLKLMSDPDTSLPTLKYQVLIYPALQTIDFNTPSYLTYKDGPNFIRRAIALPLWLAYMRGSRARVDEFADNTHLPPDFETSHETSVYASYVDPKHLPDYLHRPVKPKRSYCNTTLFNEIKHVIFDPYFAPLTASDDILEYLPPTYVLNAEIDILRDDGFFYVKRLKDLGIRVVHEYISNEEHGYMNLAGINEMADKSILDIAQFINDNS